MANRVWGRWQGGDNINHPPNDVTNASLENNTKHSHFRVEQPSANYKVSWFYVKKNLNNTVSMYRIISRGFVFLFGFPIAVHSFHRLLVHVQTLIFDCWRNILFIDAIVSLISWPRSWADEAKGDLSFEQMTRKSLWYWNSASFKLCNSTTLKLYTLTSTCFQQRITDWDEFYLFAYSVSSTHWATHLDEFHIAPQTRAHTPDQHINDQLWLNFTRIGNK